MFKRIINKLKRIIQNILFEYANKREFYNPFLSIWFAICPMIGKMGNSRHKAVLKSLLADMHSIVEKYKNRDVLDGRISDECPIWILWWQGWKFTPPIVQLCLQSVRCNARKHPVVLLSKENFREYVDIPEPIIEKLIRANNITYLSDIIRFGLLSQKGGIWLDATIYVSNTIKGWNESLYSIQHRYGNPRFVLEGKGWSTFMFASVAGQTLPSFVFESLVAYFSKHDRVIDYFLSDYLIALLYLNNENVKRQMEHFPKDNLDALAILINYRKPYNEEFLNAVYGTTYLHKLDWRLEIVAGSNIEHLKNLYAES